MQRLIDSHCHIYPENIARKAVSSIDRFYDGLPVGKVHDGTVGCLVRTGSTSGISHYIVHSVATTPHQVQSINEFIADSVKKSHGAFTGLGTLFPGSEALLEDFQHLRDLGLSGVKIHPDFQRFCVDSPEAFRVFELCESNDIPVLVHTGDFRYDYSNPDRVVNVLKAFPKLKFIGAHFGGWSVWEKARRLLPDFPNIMVDTSSSFFWLKKERAREMIRAFGPERVMFGTDYPMWPQEKEIIFLDRLGLEPDQYEKICWKNCAGLYHITFSD
jgi:predicted TIM-barrel fold metal-dependent hydrolase